MPQQRQRPIGVTILAILEVLVGILALFGSLGMFALAALLNSADFMEQLNEMGQQIPQFLIDSGPMLFLILGVVLLVFAIVAFILAWGFLKGKKWAWWLGVIFSVLQIISGAFSLLTSGVSGILSIAIPILILVYLMMASTKAWFNQ